MLSPMIKWWVGLIDERHYTSGDEPTTASSARRSVLEGLIGCPSPVVLQGKVGGQVEESCLPAGVLENCHLQLLPVSDCH